MIDIEFFKTIYIHELLNTSPDKIIEYYNNNKHLYKSKSDFYISNPDFDWKYYQKYYDLDKFNHSTEIDVISFYLKYKNELNIINQNVAKNNADNIYYVVDDKYKISKKNILLVTHELTLTGAPLTLYELCSIYGPDNDVHILNLGKVSALLTLPPNIKIVQQNMVRFSNYDIVIINTISFATISYLKSIHYRYQPNTILWVHEMHNSYYDNLKVYSNRFSFAIGLFDSENIKNKFTSLFPTMCSIFKLHNLTNFNELIPNKTINNDKLILGNFGTLCEHKNQIEIVKSIEHCIKNNHTNIILKLIKDNSEYYKSICDYINSSSVSEILKQNIHFLDENKQENILGYYNMIDIYVSSSIDEPFGKTLIESMMCKIPIVACNSGSHKLLIKHKFDGMIYNNIDELNQHLIYLYANRDEIIKLGINAYIHYKLNYSDINRYTNEWNKIMSTILNNYSKKLLKLDLVLLTEKSSIYETLECSSVIHNGKLFIFGGYVMNKQFEQTIRIIDLKTKGKKIIILDKKIAFNHLCINQFENFVYFISGQYEDAYGYATDNFYKFNLDTYETIFLTKCPFKTYCSKSIIKNNKVIVVGGAENNRACGFNECWEYDINDCIWTKLNDNKYDLIHSGSIAYNDELYIFGGNYDHAQCRYLQCNKIAKETIYVPRNDIFKLNNNNELEKMCNMSIAKSHIDDSVCEYNNIVYIFGGQTIGDCPSNNISIFIPELLVSFDIIIPKIMDYVIKGCSFKIYDNKILCFAGQYGNAITKKAIGKFNNGMTILSIK